MSCLVLSRILKDVVVAKVFGQILVAKVVVKNTGFKLNENEVPNAVLRKDSMRLLCLQRGFPFELISVTRLTICGAILNQKFFRGLMQDISFRANDHYEEPVDVSYLLTKTLL